MKKNSNSKKKIMKKLTLSSLLVAVSFLLLSSASHAQLSSTQVDSMVQDAMQ